MDTLYGRLDEIDLRLMDLLAQDSRATNVELARELNLTEGAVRKRIARLLRERYIRFTAARNLRKLGYEIEVIIAVQVDQRRIPAVVQTLRSLTPVHSIAVTTGRQDLILGACFKSREDVETFLTLVLPNVPGISRTEASYVLNVPKRTSDWVDEAEPPIPFAARSPLGHEHAESYDGRGQPEWWRG